jgi:hypothetical protein
MQQIKRFLLNYSSYNSLGPNPWISNDRGYRYASVGHRNTTYTQKYVDSPLK